MNDKFVEEWNSTVNWNDIVYYLGDFYFGNNIHGLFKMLNGSIYYLADRHHHDRHWLNNVVKYAPTKMGSVVELPPLYTIEATLARNQVIALCHYPLAVWDRRHYGAWHLHGHIHSHNNSTYKGQILDVGVDNAYAILGRYKPFSLEEVKTIMKVKND